MKASLTINNKIYDFEAAPNMPLLWVLRDLLQLTGTKYGCGIGVCGSCTVLIDKDPVRSCLLPVSSVNGKNIITIEGLDDIHPELQEAWQELNVPQCGYCQSGQLMSAAALLENKPDPSDADIDTAMSGNICRCGTYTRIRKAIHKSAALKTAKPPRS